MNQGFFCGALNNSIWRPMICSEINSKFKFRSQIQFRHAVWRSAFPNPYFQYVTDAIKFTAQCQATHFGHSKG